MPNTPPSSSPSDGESLFSLDNDSSQSSSSFSPAPQVVSHKKPQAKKTTKKSLKKEAMLDSSRIMVCMFVMSVLFFNPFNIILSSSSSLESLKGRNTDYQLTKGLNSRVLNSIDRFDINEDNSSFIPNHSEEQNHSYFSYNLVLSWVLNILLVILCLARIFISGEPYLNVDLKNDDSLWLNYQKGSKHFQRKNYEEALSCCERGLKELGQNIPKTKLQLVVGIVWQLIRLVLDKIYIGRAFSSIGCWFYGLTSRKMYKLCALFYYEMHKFSYLNMKSEKDFVLKTTTIGALSNSNSASTTPSSLSSLPVLYTTVYSYLTALYYMLATYNMSEMYSRGEMNARDEFNLCEFYFSSFLYLKFFLPEKISKPLIKYLIKKKLLQKLFNDEKSEQEDDSSTFCKLKKVKNLLRKNLFVQFLVEFDTYTSRDDFSLIKNLDNKRQKVLNLIIYKRKLFASSYLYDADEASYHFEMKGPEQAGSNSAVKSANGVASDFILQKFQDFILYKMTNHIINQSGMVSVDRILNASANMSHASVSCLSGNGEEAIDSDEEQKELADVDQTKFESLKQMYKENLEYFSEYSRNANVSSRVHQETQFVLIQFLNMLNNWKLRKFDYKVCDGSKLKNTQNSLFIESVIGVLKAYQSISDHPEMALENCKRAVNSINKFNKDSYKHNNYLVEVNFILFFQGKLTKIEIFFYFEK
jgi:hypothetical protein